MKKYEFPARIHCLKLLRTVADKAGIIKRGSRFDLLLVSHIYKQVFSFLMKNYSDIIETYSAGEERETYKLDDKIWTCWWQGENEAPMLVKRCIESMRRNAAGHEVVVIDRYNVLDFIDFPLHIIEKHEAKMMPTALLCDSLRASLLARHGGLWLDATIFCFRSIPEEIWNMPLYNNKTARAMKVNSIDKKFCLKNAHYFAPYTPFNTVSVLGGHSEHPLYCLSRDMLARYWEKYTTLMVYNLFSCTLKLAYSVIDVVKRDADAIPVNDLDRDKLSEMFKATDKAYDPGEIDALVNNDTLFYKLSWKFKYNEYTDAGEETAYKRFLEGTLMNNS